MNQMSRLFRVSGLSHHFLERQHSCHEPKPRIEYDVAIGNVQVEAKMKSSPISRQVPSAATRQAARFRQGLSLQIFRIEMGGLRSNGVGHVDAWAQRGYVGSVVHHGMSAIGK